MNLLMQYIFLKKKYPEKLKKFEESKKSEFKEEPEEHEEPEEPEKYDINDFDKYGKHKCTNTKYNFSGFDKNGFDKNGLHKDTKNKYDLNGFDKYGKHKDTNTFLDKEKNIRKDILKNIKWLKDRDEFLKLYDKILKNGEFRVINKNEYISLNIFK